MAIEDTRKLKKVTNEGPANALIALGWTLLAVCVCQDGASQYAEFHLGWQKEGEPAEPPRN
jgi:hypothetical protein